ncbi:hypothetical protein D3C73_1096850 [compost metagenome]
MPKSNIEYWNNKILRNKERDKTITETLTSEGWNVLRFWEHDIKNNLSQCISKIIYNLNLKS